MDEYPPSQPTLSLSTLGVGCGVWGAGCGVWGVGCGVQGAGCRVQVHGVAGDGEHELLVPDRRLRPAHRLRPVHDVSGVSVLQSKSPSIRVHLVDSQIGLLLESFY